MIRIDRTGFLAIPAPIWARPPRSHSAQLCSWLKSPVAPNPKKTIFRIVAGRSSRPVRVLRGGLDGNGHGVTDGAFDLLGQPALRRLFAENQAGGREGQHNHRRNGEGS